MNTQAQVRTLVAGQALQLPRKAAQLVLAEGELLVQEPASWLADTVVLSAPVRIVAPAVVAVAPMGSIRALRTSKVVLRQPEPFFSAARLLASAGRLRELLPRWTAVRSA